jgi:WD40 repeat protein
MISLFTDSSTNRRLFHGAGAELHCLSTSPPSATGTSIDRSISPPRELLQLSSSESLSFSDLSPTTVRSLLPSSAQAQVIRPIAPSLLRSNFHGHGGPIWAVDYDKESNQLFSGSYDQTIKVRILLPCPALNGMTDMGCCHRTLSTYAERSHRMDLLSLCSAQGRDHNFVS